MNGLRVSSPLPEDLESLVREIIGACISVHSQLGPGLLEVSYSRALAAELTARSIPYEVEMIVPVVYSGQIINHQRIDLFVDGRVVVEVKAVERLVPVHLAQVLSYLRLTRARVGLLINFNAAQVREGLRRVIL